MISYVQFNDWWNVGSLHSRHLFGLHDQLAYSLYSSDHYLSIDKEKMNIILSFVDYENLIFVHFDTFC